MLIKAIIPTYAQTNAPILNEEAESYATISRDTALLAEKFYQNGKKVQPVDLIEAAKWFNKSLRLLESKKPTYALGRLYVRLGGISQVLGLKNEKEEYFEKARIVILASKSKKAYRQFRNLFEDPAYYIRTIDKQKIINYADAHELLIAAGGYEKWGNIEESRRYISKAIAYFGDQDSTVYLYTLSLLTGAEIEIKFKNFVKAKKLIKKAEAIYLKQFNNHNDLIHSYLKTNVSFYEGVGDFKTCLAFYRKLKAHEIDKLTADRKASISKLQIEYETEKKEAQLRKQQTDLTVKEAKLRLQRWLLILSAVVIIGVLIGAFNLFRLMKINKRISKKNALLLVEQNHRVKNNLQFISSMLNVQKDLQKDGTNKSEIEGIQLRIESMAILQRTLYSGQKFLHTNLASFVEDIVSNVLDSCQADDTETSFELSDILISPDQALSIGLIITELTMNSCKYAFGNAITISSQLQEDKLIIKYTDSSIGIPQDIFSSANKRGFGYEMILMQIEQLNGNIELINDNTILFSFFKSKTL
ncbi:histidine kinase dimerization/phosphoacceptor domain -containing protein [Lacihabitans lacunae]|uniref:histidine kinase n=1 Tax=Lacihabitans lacunae TaxID=1028214 RepID=A0ABV7Z3S7_9BACT